MLTLSDEAVEWALKHVTTRGDTDILPLPFEYNAIVEDWEDIKRCLLVDLDAWAVRPLRKILAPKHGLGLRAATQLDPLDTLIYLALIYEVGACFEAVRVPTADARVFSYRFLPTSDGQLFDPAVTYETFRVRSLELAAAPDTGFVVMTDISDFFPRLYSHPMDNAMRAAAPSRGHPRVLMKLISQWNMSVSYGIPVGPAPSRLISEVTIADVDQSLLAEQIDFCRFSDDYRIFVPTERRAREVLAFLANVLYHNHGLTLQESKTEIVPAERFIARFQRTERDRERHELMARFADLAEAIGLPPVRDSVNRYDDMYVSAASYDYDDLDEDQKEHVDSLNLWAIVKREAEAGRALDVPMMRFVLGRIRTLRLGDPDALLLNNLTRFSPVFREVIEAVINQSGLTATDLRALGGTLLDLFNHDSVGHLDFHREWLLTPFANEEAWNHTDRLIKLLEQHHDPVTRRALTLALGRGRVAHWFKTWKHDVGQLPPWTKRAFLYGASCLPGDEAKHWYQSLRPQLDALEIAVVKYARARPLA